MMNESEGITLDKTYPIIDEEGLSTTGYTFTIKIRVIPMQPMK